MGAPKGNQFAIGNAGKSKKFNSVSDLQLAIEEYFELCDNNTKEVYVKSTQSIEKIKHPIPYTVEGLCVVLECTRETLLNYEKEDGYEEYFDTIKKAKAKILKNKVERGLMGESPPAFAIFDLVNNSDYKNAQNLDLTNKGGDFKAQQTTIVFKKYE